EGDLLWFWKHHSEMTFKDTENVKLSDIPRAGREVLPVHIGAEMEQLFALAAAQNFVPVVDDRDVFIGLVRRSTIIEYCFAGHVGIRVKLAGSNRGVDDIPIVTGWVFVNPLTEQLVMFPTSVQNVIWTKDPHEGNAHDESMTFSSAEGVNINADIGLSFHIEP